MLDLKEGRDTTAVTMADGRDYVKTDKHMLFGHHFAAIAAAGQRHHQKRLPKGLTLLAALSAVLMTLMAVVFVSAFVKWHQLLRVREPVPDRFGDLVLRVVDEQGIRKPVEPQP